MPMSSPSAQAFGPTDSGGAPGIVTDTDQFRLSVVITTFRRDWMLAEILEALLPQVTGQPAEVIIVDNCPHASTRSSVEAKAHPAVVYLHEPCSGVVHARNRGVAAANGSYLVFLDDDEVPGAGWLEAWMRQADGRTDMSFGRIVPRFLEEYPQELGRQLERNFSRDMGCDTGADISKSWAYLGTGNALFHKARCLGGAGPFDTRFNASGGEDVWLIRGLVEQGQRALWNHEAVVEELVPAERMQLSYLRMRRFNQGQLRCIMMLGSGGASGIARVLMWMGVGAIQYIGWLAASWIALLLRPDRVSDCLCRASGGAGKLLWWQKPRMQSYSTA